MRDPAVVEALWRITEFGDAAFVIPPVCGAIVALWIAGQRQNARALALAFALCLGGTVVAKILLMVLYRGGPLRSPSGHTAISAFVYGAVALLVWKWRPAGALRYAFAAACAALVVAIAVSRFEIGGHSPTETAFGLAFGAAALAFLEQRFDWSNRARTRPALALAAGSAVVLAAYFVLAPGYFDEELIAAFAHWLRGFAARA